MDAMFSNLYALVAAVNERVEGLPDSVVLKEHGRKMARCAKRIETIIFDVQPYVGEGSSALRAVLQEIESCFRTIVDLLSELADKGPLATYLQADRQLGSFQAVMGRLDSALGSLKGRLPQETQEELAAVRALLQRTRFELAPEHAALINQFRQGVDAMAAAYGNMVEATNQILGHITGNLGSLLNKEVFEGMMHELMSEHEQLAAAGDPHADAQYLRTMLDVLRLHHRTSDIPLAFTCPLTHQIMQEPVLVIDTGMTYERKAIEMWHGKGHRVCPRSGNRLGWKLHLAPNNNLRDAIEDWKLYGALSVAWQPMLAYFMQGMEEYAHAPASQQGSLTPSQSVPHPQEQPQVHGSMVAAPPFAMAETLQQQHLQPQQVVPQGIPASKQSNSGIVNSAAAAVPRASGGVPTAAPATTLAAADTYQPSLHAQPLPATAAAAHNGHDTAHEETGSEEQGEELHTTQQHQEQQEYSYSSGGDGRSTASHTPSASVSMAAAAAAQGSLSTAPAALQSGTLPSWLPAPAGGTEASSMHSCSHADEVGPAHSGAGNLLPAAEAAHGVTDIPLPHDNQESTQQQQQQHEEEEKGEEERLDTVEAQVPEEQQQSEVPPEHSAHEPAAADDMSPPAPAGPSVDGHTDDGGALQTAHEVDDGFDMFAGLVHSPQASSGDGSAATVPQPVEFDALFFTEEAAASTNSQHASEG